MCWVEKGEVLSEDDFIFLPLSLKILDVVWQVHKNICDKVELLSGNVTYRDIRKLKEKTEDAGKRIST